MVAFVKDAKAAAGIFKLGCRDKFPDPYSMYFVEVLVDLLDLQTPREIQRFFNLCQIPAFVVEVPATNTENQDEEQSGD